MKRPLCDTCDHELSYRPGSGRAYSGGYDTDWFCSHCRISGIHTHIGLRHPEEYQEYMDYIRKRIQDQEGMKPCDPSALRFED